MMASYVAVTWTVGDIITEAKLDNMVSNDQSEDAHAANGMIMNNNVAYRAKQAGGTTKDVMKLGTDDLLKLSQITKDIKGSGTIKEQILILYGWNFVLGSATTKTITFPSITFGEVPMFIPIFCGFKDGSDPSDIDAGSGDAQITLNTDSLSTTQATIRVIRADGAALTSARRYMFSYIAMGTKA